MWHTPKKLKEKESRPTKLVVEILSRDTLEMVKRELDERPRVVSLSVKHMDHEDPAVLQFFMQTTRLTWVECYNKNQTEFVNLFKDHTKMQCIASILSWFRGWNTAKLRLLIQYGRGVDGSGYPIDEFFGSPYFDANILAIVFQF